MTSRRTLSEVRHERAANPEFQAAYAETRLRFELGEAVRVRREELGWSQTRLADRAAMRQPAIARFEAGGTTPTLPVLERIAAALGLVLSVELKAVPEAATVKVDPTRRSKGTSGRTATG
ncbi:transcriptional regulator, XRE family [Catenulispora acidiphila DSM 44928]|uniref:Transcriptional regulator, XRE family n=1 Tax=Catenulispora acidiphila (strain DSM 44928 / JCM 14897 / NBRC 102108 / NRRL B-24433 / ID139908) TaxID=479433 RepID=C7Q5E7_CATAD|nr:helix-turn-helix transcriptional regulator [Catenulispora acidiphila]ACU75916.1 transcriptional regulator, XRE family [Catenulispora acidiphila DSM 44928]